MAQKIPQPLQGNNNGYDGWLRYAPLPDSEFLQEYSRCLSCISGDAGPVEIRELSIALESILGAKPAIAPESTQGVRFKKDDALPSEGYRISASSGVVEIRGNGAGLLYGTYALIRHLQLRKALANLSLESSPYYAIRMLNHWDDPKFDHTLGPYNVTRGFAGNSIFNWQDLSAEDPRYIDYARLLASSGINATCINNVNADPDLLETSYLPEIASLADRLRPYGIKLYLADRSTATELIQSTQAHVAQP